MMLILYPDLTLFYTGYEITLCPMPPTHPPHLFIVQVWHFVIKLNGHFDVVDNVLLQWLHGETNYIAIIKVYLDYVCALYMYHFWFLLGCSLGVTDVACRLQ